MNIEQWQTTTVNNLINRADEILYWLNQSFVDSDQDGDTDNEENDELGNMVEILSNQDPEQCVSTNNQEQNENAILSLDELEDMNHRTPMAASTPTKPSKKTSKKKVKKKAKGKRVTKKAMKKAASKSDWRDVSSFIFPATDWLFGT